MNSPARTVTIGLPQLRIGTDPEQNLTAAIEKIRDAARRGANIVCTPELFTSPYFCQVEDHSFFRLAQPVPGPATERLSAAVRSCNSWNRRSFWMAMTAWAAKVRSSSTC